MFHTRRLGHVESPYMYVYLGATDIKARINHRIVPRALVVATGVTANGDREVLGVDVGDSEDEAFSDCVPVRPQERGLHGVRLVISDAHAGLKASIPRVIALTSAVAAATWCRYAVKWMPCGEARRSVRWFAG